MRSVVDRNVVMRRVTVRGAQYFMRIYQFHRQSTNFQVFIDSRFPYHVRRSPPLVPVLSEMNAPIPFF